MKVIKPRKLRHIVDIIKVDKRDNIIEIYDNNRDNWLFVTPEQALRLAIALDSLQYKMRKKYYNKLLGRKNNGR